MGGGGALLENLQTVVDPKARLQRQVSLLG